MEDLPLRNVLPLGCKWNVDRSMRYEPDRAHTFYRDVLDTIEPIQVSVVKSYIDIILLISFVTHIIL